MYKRGVSNELYQEIFKHAQDLSVSVGNTYSEDQFMHTFLDNFYQGGKYSTQIYSHKTELRREGKYTDQKYLSILSLQTEFINLDRSSGCGINREIENIVLTRCTFCGDANHSAEKCSKRIRKKNEKYRAAGDSYNRQTELTPRKCLRCGSEDHLIAKCAKPPKDNEKRKNQVHLNERGNRTCDNKKIKLSKDICIYSTYVW